MFYVLVFAVIGVALVAIVLWRSGRESTPVDPAPHHHTGAENASRTPHGSPERKERKRRRAQSQHDRRKRH